MACFENSEEAYLDQEEMGMHNFEFPENIEKGRLSDRLVDPMHYLNETGHAVEMKKSSPFYLPTFQSNPVLQTGQVNEDVLQSWAHTNLSLPLEEMAQAVFVSDDVPFGQHMHSLLTKRVKGGSCGSSWRLLCGAIW